ncbi:hypothetical protein FBY35_3828 [Streptomyces sp. SLBN-118]|uniref:hypothetical protein n=1 Tax=Streptomyces sp. SLBN-118 TaxID=2768454 RepID=UPI00114F37D1|nr:hypothetical protein [Streptomyces sp. SLBN-118]TQK42424.1 hypothetical protein FBY35_3828 [Streptomyces sp. SLBN-118]
MSASSSTTMTGYGVSLGAACAPLPRMLPPVITHPGEGPGDDPGHETPRVRQAPATPAVAPVHDALAQLTLQQCEDPAANALCASKPEAARATAQRIGDACLDAAGERREA